MSDVDISMSTTASFDAAKAKQEARDYGNVLKDLTAILNTFETSMKNVETQVASTASAMSGLNMSLPDAMNNHAVSKLLNRTNENNARSAQRISAIEVSKATSDAEAAAQKARQAEAEAATALANEMKGLASELARQRVELRDTKMLTGQAYARQFSQDMLDKRMSLMQSKIDRNALLNDKDRNPDKYAARFKTNHLVGNALSQAGGNLAGKQWPFLPTIGGAMQLAGAAVTNPALGVATAITKLANGITELGDKALQAYGDIEKLKVNLGVVTGSEAQATSLFSDISQYALKSPFGVQQTTDMAVLLKQSGVYQSEVMDTLKMIGDTAGGNIEKMQRLANVYAQVEAAGTVTMRQMRQFAMAGLPMYRELASMLNTTQTGMRSKISRGEVTSDDIRTAFERLTSENGPFYKAVEKGAKTLQARMQNLEDARNLAYANLGELLTNFGDTYGTGGFISKTVSFAEDIAQGVGTALEEKNIKQNLQQIANARDEVTRLMSLRDYAEKTGNDELKSLLDEKIDRIADAIDPEKEVAGGAELYDRTKASRDAYLRIQDLQEQIDINEAKRISLEKELQSKGKATIVGSLRNIFDKDAQQQLSSLTALVLEAKNEIKSIDPHGDIQRYWSKKANVDAALSPYESSKSQSAISNMLMLFRDTVWRTRAKKGGVDEFTAEQLELKSQTQEGKAEAERIKRENNDRIRAMAQSHWESTVDSEGSRLATMTERYADDTFDNLYTWITNFAEARDNMDMTFDAILRNEMYDKKTDKLTEKGREQIIQMADYMGGFYPALIEELKKTMPTEGASIFVSGIQSKITSLARNAKAGLDVPVAAIETVSNSITQVINEIESYVKLGKISREKAEKLNVLLSTGYGNFEIDDSQRLMNYDDVADKAGKDNQRLLAPLWKRIISASTSIPTDLLADTEAEAMRQYEMLSNRRTVSSALAAQLRGGNVPMNDILSAIRYTGNESRFRYSETVRGTDGKNVPANSRSYVMTGADNKGVLEIDWRATRAALEDMAKSGRMSASGILSLKESSDQNTRVMEDLFQKAFETGDSDPAAIQSFSQMMLNAFSGMKLTESGTLNGTRNGENVAVKINKDGQYVDAATGELIDSFEELRFTTADLMKFIDESIRTSRSKSEAMGAIGGFKKAIEDANTATSDARVRSVRQTVYGGVYSSASRSGLSDYEADKIASRTSELVNETVDNTILGLVKAERINPGSQSNSVRELMKILGEDFGKPEEQDVLVSAMNDNTESVQELTNAIKELTGADSVDGDTADVARIKFPSFEDVEGRLWEDLLRGTDYTPDIRDAAAEYDNKILTGPKIGKFPSFEEVKNDMLDILLSENDFTTEIKKRRSEYKDVFPKPKIGNFPSFEDVEKDIRESLLRYVNKVTETGDINLPILKTGNTSGTGDVTSVVSDVLAENNINVKELTAAIARQNELESNNTKNDALSAAASSWLNIPTGWDAVKRGIWIGGGRGPEGNTNNQQRLLEDAGYGNSSWSNEARNIATTIATELRAELDRNGGDASALGGTQRRLLDIAGGDMASLDSLLDKLNNPNSEEWRKIADAFAEILGGARALSSEVSSLTANFNQWGENVIGGAVTSTMESLGASIAQNSDAAADLTENLRRFGQSMMQQLGDMLVMAGLRMIADPTAPWQAGLALILAGGMASLVSGLMSSNDKKESSEDEISRLNNLKDQMADLLEQARNDAIYYENELRHRRALSTSQSVSSQGAKVNDAIITPNGNIISTHPDDWLIATKTPETLVGGKGASAPVVNLNIQNNSGVQMAVKKRQTDDGEGNVSIEAVIEAVVGDFISSGRSDNAFNAREGRIQGRMVTA